MRLTSAIRAIRGFAGAIAVTGLLGAFCAGGALAGPAAVGQVVALSGAAHLTMVMRTAPWHAGLNLYNNGLAGGLTATLIVAIIDWWSSWREEHRAGR